MERILVPYHHSERYPVDEFSGSPDRVVTTDAAPADNWGFFAELFERVATAVASAGSAQVQSGDCLTALGTVAGLQRAGHDPAVVWLDAHGDVQTLETSTSGYLGGLSLRLLLGYRPELIADRLGLRPVPVQRAVLVDARDLDPPEVDFIAASGLRHVPVAELTTATLPAGPLYVHVDYDVVDGAELPGLRFPVPGGPPAHEVLAALRRVLDTGRVVGLGLCCTRYRGTDTSAAERERLDALAALG